MRKIIFFSGVSYLWFLVACPCFGQAGKPVGSVYGDLESIGDFLLDELSPDGSWVAFHMIYTTGKDTLFIQNTDSGKRHALPLANRPDFVGNNDLVAYLPGNKMLLLDLKSGKKKVFDDAYHIKSSSNKAVLLIKDDGTQKEIKVCSLAGEALMAFAGVSSFSYNEATDALAMVLRRGNSQVLQVVRLGNAAPLEIPLANNNEISYLTWQKKGEALGFVQTAGGKATTYVVDIKTRKVSTLDLSAQQILQNYSLSGPAIQLAEQDSRMYLYLTLDQPKPTSPEICEIWNAQDEELYSRRKKYPAPILRVAKWERSTGAVSWISGPEHHYTDVLPGDRFALCSKKNEHSKQRGVAYRVEDFDIVDMEKNITIPFLRNFNTWEQLKSSSPNGKNVVFFDKGNWQHIDLTTMVVTNLTKGTANHHFDAPEIVEMVEGLAGWINDSTVLAYDHFDIWALSPHKATRLTDGAKTGKRFRLSKLPLSTSQLLDMQKGILLSSETQSSETSGVYLLNNNGLKRLVEKPRRIWDVKTAGRTIVYIQEDSNEPRGLYAIAKSGKPKLIFQSNPSQLKKGPPSKIVQYTLPSGRQLHGVLYFPHGYDKAKTYPMLVYIYETQTHKNHKYVMPTLHETDGFSKSLSTGEGYFVFYPDIEYEIGDTGKSATVCVEAGVRAMLAAYPIDAAKVGLVGHSFGGFEASFIITQTNIFAAAVAGAGMTDLVSMYLTEKEGYAQHHFDYMELDQIRLGKGFFEDKEMYRRNSAVYHADRITTPLLLWTGTKDAQVPPSQTYELHFALRKLGKTNVMLKYLDEPHSLDKAESKIDLTVKILEWFGHYLKGGPKPAWTEPK